MRNSPAMHYEKQQLSLPTLTALPDGKNIILYLAMPEETTGLLMKYGAT
jgi:hypothetical protein